MLIYLLMLLLELYLFFQSDIHSINSWYLSRHLLVEDLQSHIHGCENNNLQIFCLIICSETEKCIHLRNDTAEFCLKEVCLFGKVLERSWNVASSWVSFTQWHCWASSCITILCSFFSVFDLQWISVSETIKLCSLYSVRVHPWNNCTYLIL